MTKKHKFIFIGIPIILGIAYILRYKILVLALVFGGYFIAPEASAILSNYCFHKTDTMHLDSSYIQRSPVIIKYAKKLKIGQSIKCPGFKQNLDYRLSYALNPFTITRKKNGYTVSQWIEFDRKGKLYTDLNLYIFKVRVFDNFVHTFDCSPFLVVCNFQNLQE